MKMIKFIGIVLAFLLMVGLNSEAFARAYGTESITVSNASIGFTDSVINPGTSDKPIGAMFTVEGAPIRYTLDGTTPTTTVGILAEVGDIVTLEGQADTQAFRAIRTTSTDATINPQYFNNRVELPTKTSSAANLKDTSGNSINPATSDNQTNGAQKSIRVDSNGREVIQLVTAFGDNRTAELHPQIQQSFEYTVGNTDLNTNTVTNSGTVTQGLGMGVVSTGTTTDSIAWLRSEHHAKYRPGLGGLLRFSALFTTPITGTEQFIGIMDERGSSADFVNGYALGYNDDTEIKILRWQNDVLFEVAQSDWDDSLDGLGRSGLDIDFTKLNVFDIQYQYLGAGSINYWVENPITGIPFIFHSIQYANANISPSTHNPNYHFVIYVDNGATTSDLVMKIGSYGYFIEGLTRHIEVHQPQNSSETRQKTGVTTEVAIFSIRNKATYASKTNFIDIYLEHWTGSIEASSTNNLGSIRLVRNTTLGGTPSWNDINATNSVVEIDIAGTTLTGGTELIPSELAGKNDRNNENISPFEFLIHPGETITLAASSANSATIRGSLLWRELF